MENSLKLPSEQKRFHGFFWRRLNVVSHRVVQNPGAHTATGGYFVVKIKLRGRVTSSLPYFGVRQLTQVSDVALEGDPVVDLDLVLPGNAAEVGPTPTPVAVAAVTPLLFRPLLMGPNIDDVRKTLEPSFQCGCKMLQES